MGLSADFRYKNSTMLLHSALLFDFVVLAATVAPCAAFALDAGYELCIIVLNCLLRGLLPFLIKLKRSL